MFVDARQLQSDTAFDCDICIMGAGAAGITLARELSGQPLKVCMLESGGFDFEDETQALYKGEVTGRYYPPLDTARLRFFGGSTNHWDGNCSPLSPLDFADRPWIEHSGWPFDRQHIDPFYERAQSYCQLGPYRYDAAYWAPLTGGPPLPLDGAKVDSAIAQLSPPTRFGEVYRDDLERADNITVLLNANVLEILPRPDDAGRIDSVRVGVLKGGTFPVRARHFIIALGGIENVRLLLLSNSRQPNGLGNQNDLVGRFFMEHPVVDGAAIKLSDPGRNMKLYGMSVFGDRGLTAFLELSEAAQREHGLLNIRAPLSPRSRYEASDGIESANELIEALEDGPVPNNIWYDVASVIRDIDMVAEAGSRKLFKRRLFSSAEEIAFLGMDTMVEQTPDSGNRISLSDQRDALGQRRVQLQWEIQQRVQDDLWRCYEVIGAELGRTGVGRLRSSKAHAARLWGRHRLNYGYHHIGTTRMHANSRRGVVDADCRVHGLANLYIAGSSVFPTGGHVPPTLTIVALAIRLADHLKRVAGERS